MDLWSLILSTIIISLKHMSATSAPPNPEHMALLKFGIAVPPQHR